MPKKSTTAQKVEQILTTYISGNPRHTAWPALDARQAVLAFVPLLSRDELYSAAYTAILTATVDPDSAHAVTTRGMIDKILANRYAATGLTLFDDIRRSAPGELARIYYGAYSLRADGLTALAGLARNDAGIYIRRANRISTPAAEAQDARKQAKWLTASAAAWMNQAQDIRRNAAAHDTNSAYGDMYSAAFTTLTAGGTYGQACTAAQIELTAYMSAHALQTHQTHVERVPDAQLPALYAQFAPIMGNAPRADFAALTIPQQRKTLIDTISAAYNGSKIPFIGRKGKADGYIQYAIRDTMHYPLGLYCTHARLTAPAYVSYDKILEDAQNGTPNQYSTQIVTNGGYTLIQSAPDYEAIETLVQATGLNQREHDAIYKYFDFRAAQDGQAAVNAHIAAIDAECAAIMAAVDTSAAAAGVADAQAIAEARKKATARVKRIRKDKASPERLDEIRTAARLDSALLRAGYPTDKESRARAWRRLRDKLQSAHDSLQPHQITPEEQERRALEFCQRNRQRTTNPEQPPRVLWAWLDNPRDIAQAAQEAIKAAGVPDSTLARAARTIAEAQAARAAANKAWAAADAIKAGCKAGYIARQLASAAEATARQIEKRAEHITPAIRAAVKAKSVLDAIAQQAAADDSKRPPVMRWVRRPHAVTYQVITPAQAAAEEAARRADAAAGARHLAIWHAIGNASPYNAGGEYTAAYSAGAFIAAYSLAETTEGIKAEAAAAAARRATAAAEAAKMAQEAAEAQAKARAKKTAWLAKCERQEAAAAARKAAQDAQQASSAAAWRERYNNALRAALHRMGVTWRNASPAQRQQASSAARKAANK